MKVPLHSQGFCFFQVLSLTCCLQLSAWRSYSYCSRVWWYLVHINSCNFSVSSQHQKKLRTNRFVGCLGYRFSCCCLQSHPTRDVTTVSSAMSGSPNNCERTTANWVQKLIYPAVVKRITKLLPQTELLLGVCGGGAVIYFLSRGKRLLWPFNTFGYRPSCLWSLEKNMAE